MRQDATLRRLDVVGQAVKNLSEETKSRQPHIPWKQIAGMRDKIIHDYFGVNLEIVWAVVEKELPKLRSHPSVPRNVGRSHDYRCRIAHDNSHSTTNT